MLRENDRGQLGQTWALMDDQYYLGDPYPIVYDDILDGGFRYNGTMEVMGDLDTFTIEMGIDSVVEIYLNSTDSGTDTFLTLYEEGGEVKENDNLAEILHWTTATASGGYEVTVTIDEDADIDSVLITESDFIYNWANGSTSNYYQLTGRSFTSIGWEMISSSSPSRTNPIGSLGNSWRTGQPPNTRAACCPMGPIRENRASMRLPMTIG